MQMGVLRSRGSYLWSTFWGPIMCTLYMMDIAENATRFWIPLPTSWIEKRKAKIETAVAGAPRRIALVHAGRSAGSPIHSALCARFALRLDGGERR